MTGQNGPAVVLFVFNRPRHTAAVLEGLRRNAVESLYVFSDAPRGPRDEQAVAATREMVRAQDWATITLVEREHNLGLARSIVSGVTEVLRTHDRLVVLEDDCVPLDGFYRYMQRALRLYESADDVACISGYGPPRVRRPVRYAADGYFTQRISSWGWGTWRRAWEHLDTDWPRVRQQLDSSRPDLAAAGADLGSWLGPQAESRIGREVWTPLWLFPLLLAGKKTLWPFRSYVENIGFDGTGVNCGPDETSRGAPPVPPESFRFPQTTDVVPSIARKFARSIARPREGAALVSAVRDALAGSPTATRVYYRARQALRLPDANANQTYERLRRFAAGRPRYRPGSFEFPFGEVEYVDALSLLYQYREIFVERGYDFRCEHDSPLILDCGGNVGLSAIRFKQQHPGARVRVFEADPRIADVLERNLGRLGLSDVQVVRAAVWTRDGDVPFSPDGADSGHVSNSASTPPVRCVRLAGMIDEPVDLLKLDVEGAEFPVLRDLHGADRLRHVQRLVCEVHGRPAEGESVPELLSILEDAGFRMSVGHARAAADLSGQEVDHPFQGLPSGKFLLHLYAWRAPGAAG